MKKATHKQYTNLFVKCNLRAEKQACATVFFSNQDKTAFLKHAPDIILSTLSIGQD